MVLDKHVFSLCETSSFLTIKTLKKGFNIRINYTKSYASRGYIHILSQEKGRSGFDHFREL